MVQKLFSNIFTVIYVKAMGVAAVGNAHARKLITPLRKTGFVQLIPLLCTTVLQYFVYYFQFVPSFLSSYVWTTLEFKIIYFKILPNVQYLYKFIDLQIN